MTGATWPSPGRDIMKEADRVELSVPSKPDLLFLVRMTAAAVASRADFGYDQIEDLRLAIDELCLSLFGEEATDGRVQLLFKWGEDAIEVVATYQPGDDDHQPRQELGLAQLANELSERILDALVDEHGTDLAGGLARAWLRMRRRQGGHQ
ncbi:MAG TPA: hypothetical protein VMV14_07020 [Acidimicrobiales bacterium]|nr:hypothetical protein [Acidimicrobiales bacterium]